MPNTSQLDRLEVLTKELEERERDIEASRATLRLIVDASRIGIWDWRIADDSLYWNGTMRKMWGYCCGMDQSDCTTVEGSCDRPEFPGSYESFIAGIAPEDRDCVEAVIGRCLKDGVPFSMVYTVAPKGGRRRRIDARGSVLFDADRRPLRMVGICIPLDEERTDPGE